MAYIYDLTDTWNAGGTTFNAIKMNVTDSASAAGSKLVTLQTNGTEHFSVTKAGVGYFSGNVGIGTSNPFAKLEVNGGIRASVGSGGQLELYEANPTRANVLIAGANASGAFVDASYASGGSGALLLRTLGTERMRIDASGNVGIGTSSPAVKLEVASADAITSLRVDTENAGVSASNYSEVALADNNAVRTWWRNVRDGTGKTAFGYNNHLAFLSDAGGTPTERMRITSAGNVGIGTTNPIYPLVVSNGGAAGLEFSPNALASAPLIQSYNRSGGAYTQLGFDALQYVFRTSGSERMRIDASGNVGIGTSSPTSRLNIVGGSLATSGVGGGIVMAGNITTSRLLSGGGATVQAIHTYSDDNAYEISAGSTSGYVTGIGIAARSYTGTGGDAITLWTRSAERLRIKSSGGVRYIPLASAPSSPEAGEVYYDSTTNKLRCYNGTTWNDLF